VSEVRVVRGGELSPGTSQTPGMKRMTAIGGSEGARNLWVGRVTLEPGAVSGAHHHGTCESVICVTAGRIKLRYGPALEHSVEAGPGDYLFIPPELVHQEINLSEGEPIDSIVIRDSQENVVVNVDIPGA
jgi:uncharacterized RmlC-like cupin family protein